MTDLDAEIRNSLAAQGSLVEQLDVIRAIADRIVEALRGDGKVLACGNGGSAADAEHMVAELVCRYVRDRDPFPAVALTANSSLVTATANDHGFDDVFARQVAALARAGDVVVGISTSGRSANVVRAMRIARERGAFAVGLTGRDGGDLRGAVDIALYIDSDETPRIQEGHRLAIHCICALVESALSGG